MINVKLLLQRFFDSAFFTNTNPSPRQSFMAGFLFLLLTPIALGIDSTWFLETYFDGRWLANGLVLIYFCWLFTISGSYLRKLIFTMVFVSYVGELIFSTLLGMYTYRSPGIPLYVPLGHSIVYASGYVYAHSQLAHRFSAALDAAFPVLFIVILLIPTIFLNDMFTLVFGFFFFWILKRKKWQPVYYFIALCVIYIELIGTSFQCWTWAPETFGVIPAVNPPMGAIFFYAGGDVLVGKVVNLTHHD